MSALQPPRGTHDLIGEEQRRHAHVVATAKRVLGLYGFDEWATPVFEDTRVFARTLGDTSDVVTKEMYSFDDRGGDTITLRPEGTAGICRALVTNGLTQSLPQKIFYAGPMFRYERPQKGRYRQFHQIGAELIGPGRTPGGRRSHCRRLGHPRPRSASPKTRSSRSTPWATAPAATPTATPWSPISPPTRMRCLPKAATASSATRCASWTARTKPTARWSTDAPTIAPHLTPEAAKFYETLLTHLQRFGVPFRENPRIVRGLDYYNHTAFEFVTEALGAQGTVMAGGRYDGLVEQMGGPATPAVGWAAGIDRLGMLLPGLAPEPPAIAVIPVGDAAEAAAIGILQQLRALPACAPRWPIAATSSAAWNAPTKPARAPP